MDVFGTAKNHCEALRAELQKRQSENATRLSVLAEQIRAKFEDFAGSVLAGLTTPTVAVLKSQIELGEAYTDESGLTEKLKKKEELEKATSEEGLKLLKGEFTSLKSLRGEIKLIVIAAEKLVEVDPVTQSKTASNTNR